MSAQEEPVVWPVDSKGRAEVGFERHVFICTNEREPGNVRGCCLNRGGGAVRDRFKAGLAMRKLGGRIRPNAAGCLDFCEFGPVVVVYPEGVWYRIQELERDVDEIIERHLIGGEVVERCRLHLQPPAER